MTSISAFLAVFALHRCFQHHMRHKIVCCPVPLLFALTLALYRPLLAGQDGRPGLRGLDGNIGAYQPWRVHRMMIQDLF